jgi:low temperature requirement protein LtrA
VAQVAEPLREHYSVAGIVRFSPLFVLIWRAWTGHTNFSTRFDTDDVVQRGLTLLQILAVAAMAANARARSVPGARELATRYLVGHGIAACVWLGSALLPAPQRFIAWPAAFALDLGTPWVAVPHSVKARPTQDICPSDSDCSR